MDALMPALVAGLLLGIGDRTGWLAALLADRGRGMGVILASALVAFALGNAAAAWGAGLLPPLTPNAARLLLVLALVFGAAGALWPARRPASFAGWPPVLALLVLGFGEGVQFVTFALAAGAATPALAAVGATLGSVAALLVPAALGEAGWRRLPLRAVRIAVGVILAAIAAVLALGALRLT